MQEGHPTCKKSAAIFFERPIGTQPA